MSIYGLIFCLYPEITLVQWKSLSHAKHYYHVVEETFNEGNVKEGRTVRYGIILGFCLSPDGKMENFLIDRLNLAAKVYQNEDINKMIVSGGPQGGVTQSSLMKTWLTVEENIPSELILEENKSNTTWENAVEVYKMISSDYKNLIASESFTKPISKVEVIIITSTFHQLRSFWTFLHAQKMHFTNIPPFNQIPISIHVADFNLHNVIEFGFPNPSNHLDLTSSKPLLLYISHQWHFIREMGALLKYLLTNRFSVDRELFLVLGFVSIPYFILLLVSTVIYFVGMKTLGKSVSKKNINSKELNKKYQ
eukprot:TRINITY_DN16239_c0_g1_i1.p1 TRINITY_DN16239_c0_g1~~TRINITY_DN16239_c0_g1_i1.p1  ORF type:complete len:307 (+),score=29.43 TRINITY_DN16239_c0_g1_i1:123-1043(+)